MFKFKKIIYILMIIIMFLASFLICFGQSKVKAEVTLNEEINLVSEGDLTRCKYEGEPIKVDVVYYEKNGKRYPAYGLDRTKNSVTPKNPYSVNVDSLITNQRVWRAIINGYPFKTPEELGCGRMEAYYATKIAVYDAFYNFNLDEFTESTIGDDTNKKAIQAIKSIIQLARSPEQTKIMAKLNIKEENKDWQVDSLNSNYVSKTYTVTASAPNENYKVSITGNNIKTFKITDLSNNPKTTFSSGEKFKILLPIADLQTSGEFIINLTSSLKTYPIYHAKDSKGLYEDFAITVGEYETVQTSYKQIYEKNKTKIKILKQDGDNKNPLQGAVFNLLDQNKSIIYSDLITNEKGIIEILNLMPGLYYLEEVAAPNGYYGYGELIEVNINMQDELEITVDNFKEEEKVVPKAPIEKHYTPTKKLPATGF